MTLADDLATIRAALDRIEAETAPPAPPKPADPFGDKAAKLGASHYYPLATDAHDTIGGHDGSIVTGPTFDGTRCTFAGTGNINLGDHDDFSVATTGGLTIAMTVAITDWHGKGGNGEYIHFAGKGATGQHEWTFRHYVKDGIGEAPTRQGRMSFYHYNLAGGLGAGSYYQVAAMPTTERVVVATCDRTTIKLYVDGVLRDSDPLSGYNIVPANGTAPARLGTRGDGTGSLVGTMRRVAFFGRVLSAAEVASLMT